jgi:hypothetical protein
MTETVVEALSSLHGLVFDDALPILGLFPAGKIDSLVVIVRTVSEKRPFCNVIEQLAT